MSLGGDVIWSRVKDALSMSICGRCPTQNPAVAAGWATRGRWLAARPAQPGPAFTNTDLVGWSLCGSTSAEANGVVFVNGYLRSSVQDVNSLTSSTANSNYSMPPRRQTALNAGLQQLPDRQPIIG
jgi:hypothetical protein